MIGGAKKSGNSSVYYMLGLLFALTFVCFYWIGDYVLFFQENNSLFIFSDDYLGEYLKKPGGPLELAGNFLSQFYNYSGLGAIIIACVIILVSVLFLRINKELSISG